ncbi:MULTISPECIES: CgeB family protein [unclassified Paenibacillus]|uniref:CgeB family protein n=1 Tax=unclassified Paenibacillus TaxID=185978 RepID=UPI000838F598|nr:glycosyltransferase [Paenibacillus sp. 79R4]NWL88834.1 spore maturation protein cgeB [Paenibacillus sp. 79R4]
MHFTRPFPGKPSDNNGRKGWEDGLRDGYAEGYLRGHAKVIVERNRPSFPIRQIKVLYVTSGKGFPYMPMDEAVVETLKTLTENVITVENKQPIQELAAMHRPDLVLVLDGMDLPVEQIDGVRALGIRTAIWLTDDPYYTDMSTKIAPHYDYVFTLERNCVDIYRALGCPNVYYLPFAAYVGHYRPTLTRSAIRRQISFIGSAYWNRIEFLRPIIGGLMEQGLMINGIWWDRLPEYSQYPDRIEIGKWMGPVETSEVYSGTKIVINMHRSAFDETVNNNTARVEALSLNPRTFEISACGTLQLVDIREDLASFYKPGVEIETFSSSDELMDKVNYYLSHEKERQQIALRALERTFSNHTYSHRLNELLGYIFG